MSVLKKHKIAGTLAVFGVVGLVVAPVASAVTGTSTVRATIGATISLNSTTGTVSLPISPIAGGNQTTASDSISVTTNKANGYNLGIISSVAALTNGANTIPATAGTWASAIALANNTWGYAVPSGTTGITVGSNFDATYTATTDQASNALKFAAVPTTNYVIRTTAVPATNDITTVWYSAKADATKPTGNYDATITYTALTN